MIDVKNPSNQHININSNSAQEIIIANTPYQQIDISVDEPQEVDILNEPDQLIDVLPIWPSLTQIDELALEISTKVPKALDILPRISSAELSTLAARETSRIYIQVGEVPSFATLEQIKELNTKTVFVDRLSDTKVHNLSNEDIIMLRKE